ncbi:MAG: glycoside hydrolase family 3 C-terminal domain-containing protein, partial [Pseudomonadota bacterium]
GETPHAEMKGDIAFPGPLQHSALFPADFAALKAVSGKGAPVVTVLYSGRTTFANDLMNLSDAFVSAFLPGTEADGLADLLLRKQDGAIAYDFTGVLPFSWPGSACAADENADDEWLFPRGYGLSYAERKEVGQLPAPEAPETCEAAAP